MTQIFQTIADLKLNILAELYNSVAEKPIKKFADKETGVKRVTEIAKEKGMHLAIVGGRFALVENEPDFAADGAGVDTTEDIEMSADEQLAFVNEHRAATGHEAFESLTTEELATQIALVEEHAPHGNDPWAETTEVETDPAVGEAAAKSLADQIAEAQAKRLAAKGGKAKGGARGPAPLHADTKVVKILVDKNPKKVGTASHARFELYTDGMTVGDFVKAGGKRADLDWDVDHKFVALS